MRKTVALTKLRLVQCLLIHDRAKRIASYAPVGMIVMKINVGRGKGNAKIGFAILPGRPRL